VLAEINHAEPAHEIEPKSGGYLSNGHDTLQGTKRFPYSPETYRLILRAGSFTHVRETDGYRERIRKSLC